MYKKIISTLVIGTLLAGTLTGCGGSSDAGSSAKSSGKTELELFSTKPENKDTIQKLVDKYNESHDDVTVKVTAPPDAGTVLKTRMAKNDMPDIVAMGGDNNYTEVEGAGMLLDLGDQDYIKDVQEAFIDMVYDVSLRSRTENDMNQLDMMFDDQVIRILRDIQNHWLPERTIIYGDDRMYTESQYQAEKMHQAIDDAVTVLLEKM